jgi:hypothetical protein
VGWGRNVAQEPGGRTTNVSRLGVSAAMALLVHISPVIPNAWIRSEWRGLAVTTPGKRPSGHSRRGPAQESAHSTGPRAPPGRGPTHLMQANEILTAGSPASLTCVTTEAHDSGQGGSHREGLLVAPRATESQESLRERVVRTPFAGEEMPAPELPQQVMRVSATACRHSELCTLWISREYRCVQGGSHLC